MFVAVSVIRIIQNIQTIRICFKRQCPVISAIWRRSTLFLCFRDRTDYKVSMPLYTRCSRNTSPSFKGRQLILWNTSPSHNERQLILWNTSPSFKGRQLFLWNTSPSFKGRQLISWNTSPSFNGRQLILWNTSPSFKGRQLILWNNLLAQSRKATPAIHHPSNQKTFFVKN